MTDHQEDSRQAPKILLIGIGSDERGDDAVGLKAARRIEALQLANVKVEIEQREGTALVMAWSETSAERVILVDAMQSGAEPGTFVRIRVTDQDFSTQEWLGSTHGIGIGQAIEMGRALGNLPSDLVLYLVEGVHFGLGDSLSQEVSRALDTVVHLLSQELRPL